MHRLMLATALCVLGLFAATPAQAAPIHGPTHGHAYYHTHGVRFSGGYYYHGYNHSHWGHRTWDPVYRRYNYWDPSLRVYFYWCPVRGGYYPCGY